MARVRHPDKPGGNTIAFQELLNAYRRIIDYIEGNKRREAFEADDGDFETEFFMKHNFMKECSSSFVVYVQDSFVERWKSVLQRPMKIHKSDKFRIIFKTGSITLTFYIKPKKDPRSKLHIQSGDQDKNLDFILEKLSMFYREVCETDPKVLQIKDMQRSVCVICSKNFTNKRGLKQHMIRMHGNKTSKTINSGNKHIEQVTLEEIVEGLKSKKPDECPDVITLSQPLSSDIRSPLPKKKKLENISEKNTDDEMEFIRNILKEVVDQSALKSATNHQCGECGEMFVTLDETEVRAKGA